MITISIPHYLLDSIQVCSPIFLFPFMNLKLLLPLSSWFPFSKYFSNCQYLIQMENQVYDFICNWKIDICICISTSTVTGHQIPQNKQLFTATVPVSASSLGPQEDYGLGCREIRNHGVGSTCWWDSMEPTASSIPQAGRELLRTVAWAVDAVWLEARLLWQLAKLLPMQLWESPSPDTGVQLPNTGGVLVETELNWIKSGELK